MHHLQHYIIPNPIIINYVVVSLNWYFSWEQVEKIKIDNSLSPGTCINIQERYRYAFWNLLSYRISLCHFILIAFSWKIWSYHLNITYYAWNRMERNYFITHIPLDQTELKNLWFWSINVSEYIKYLRIQSSVPQVYYTYKGLKLVLKL